MAKQVPDLGREQPLRLLQVGLGGFGTSWAGTVVPSVPAVELVACVDPDPSALVRAQSVTTLAAGRCFSSLDSALARVEADAVLIAAPLMAHVPSAVTALEAGKHVLVEKPFAPTMEEAYRAVDAAASSGLILMVSQNYRFFPAVRAVSSLVRAETYGKPDAVYLDFRRYDNATPKGTYRHYLFPQPMVVDMAIHHFDLMRLILGREPVEVFCRSWNPPWSNFEEPAEAMAQIRFDDNVMVSYRGSWLSNGTATPWAGDWRIELSDGEIAWTSRDGTPIDSSDTIVARDRDGKTELIDLPHVEHIDRSGSLSAFTEAIRSGNEPDTSGRRNLKTLALTLAAVESSLSGKPVLL